MTKEILLLKQYSALVDKLQAENEVLRELLVKKQNDYVLMYNSRERHKVLYTNLLNSITRHCEDLKDTIAYKAQYLKMLQYDKNLVYKDAIVLYKDSIIVPKAYKIL